MSQEKKHTNGLPSGTKHREFEHMKEEFQGRSEELKFRGNSGVWEL